MSTKETPSRLLQANIRPSVFQRLEIEKARRGYTSRSQIVDVVLDEALPGRATRPAKKKEE